MPIAKRWSRATKSSILSKVPEKRGIYELKSFGEVVYVGRTNNLRRRLLSHLTDRNPNYYRYEDLGFDTDGESLEREHYERLVERLGRPPRWNDGDL